MLVEGSFLSLVRSTVADNQPPRAGLSVFDFAAVELRNSIVSGNCGAISGFEATVEFIHSTIADNDCLGQSAPAIVGDYFSLRASRSVFSSPLNTQNCGGGNFFNTYSGGYNVGSDGSCLLNDPTDFPGVDPRIGPL
jgi:hypothetical protein